MSATCTEPEAAPTTEDDHESDHILHTALKKLKMDSGSECACTVTKEADNQALLKHKHDPNITARSVMEEQEEAREKWSETLQNFCLCDPQPDGGQSNSHSEPLYHCHRHRRKKSKSTSVRNSLNLAHAAGVRKPVLREPKLLFPVDVKGKKVPVLRASCLKVASKADVSQGIPSVFTDTVASASYTNATATTSFSVSSTVVSSQSPCEQSGAVRATAVFMLASTGHRTCFSSLSSSVSSKDREKPAESVPQFNGYRDNMRPSSVFTPRLPNLVLPAGNTLSTSPVSAQESIASPPPTVVSSAARLDLTMDRSCSQEARLDEMSVNELAAYFEDFIHIPKKMSSMAEMMYA